MHDEVHHRPMPDPQDTGRDSPHVATHPSSPTQEDDFLVCGALKSRKVVLFIALLGASLCVMLGVILITVLPWFAFPTVMDFLILGGIISYIIGGVIASVFVYLGTKRNRPGLFTPFLLLYGTLILIGMGAAIVGIAKMVSDQTPEVDTMDAFARIIIVVVPAFVIIQILLIYFIWQYKKYLSWKLQRRVVIPAYNAAFEPI